MNKKNWYWVIGGSLNLLVAIIHTIGGQLDLVNPLLESNLAEQARTEWLGVWHMVTIVLFVTTFYLLKKGFSKDKEINVELIQFIGMLYVLFSIAFVISSLVMQVFAPQWILLFPIGVLAFLGLRKKIESQSVKF